MDPKLSKNWRKAEPRLQDLPTANLGRISDPQVAIRPSSPAPEDAAVWLHPAAVLPAPQIANLWRAPEPEIATQRYLTYIQNSDLLKLNKDRSGQQPSSSQQQERAKTSQVPGLHCILNNCTFIFTGIERELLLQHHHQSLLPG